MRILIVSQYFWPEGFRINEVAKSLLGKGIEVEVLTGKPNYPRGEIFAGYRAWGCQRETCEGIKINRIPLLARGGRMALGDKLPFLRCVALCWLAYKDCHCKLAGPQDKYPVVVKGKLVGRELNPVQV